MITKAQTMPQTFPQEQRPLPAAFHAPMAKNQWEREEAFREAMHSTDGASFTEKTPDPLPVTNTLLPVLPFTLEMVPEPLQNWLKDVAYRRQCPLDFVAIPAIIMIASLIGARCAVKPNTKDDWTVVPNLWGGNLGDPGTLKTPICSEVLFPFGYLELKAKKEYREKKSQYEAEKAVFLEAKN